MSTGYIATAQISATAAHIMDILGAQTLTVAMAVGTALVLAR